MDYWFPASSVCETIATGELVTGQAKVEHFCFLKLTKAPRHECDEGTKAIDGRNNIPLYVATYELLAPTPSSAGPRENAAMETDDWALLNELVQKDHVILTPSQAHDDFYVIDYAVKYNGFIVTNDMFRDHVSNKRTFHGKRLTSNWVRSHCIDFTFVGKEFMPNPRAMERVFNFQPSAIDSLPSAMTPSSTNSRLQKTQSNDEIDVGADDDVNEDGMVVDHKGARRNKNIDLSEVTYYKVPRELLPMLHGEGGETMEKFQEYTGTYIVLPSHTVSVSPSARPLPNVLTLSIYG
ncbi:hypothetical protein JG687_00007409 [Phytophthora cactorum]|uniref:RNase NYN domain-containing protein n=1 Tax=Phytophthora cactorum TaxID=29920 RepID=A0A8T1UGP5_9STRA|nr:hypothetical protein JG687_00007409 [Phytophthora cactorum]